MPITTSAVADLNRPISYCHHVRFTNKSRRSNMLYSPNMPGVNVFSSVTKYLTRSAERVFKYGSHVNTTAGFLLQRSVNRSPARAQPQHACQIHVTLSKVADSHLLTVNPGDFTEKLAHSLPCPQPRQGCDLSKCVKVTTVIVMFWEKVRLHECNITGALVAQVQS